MGICLIWTILEYTGSEMEQNVNVNIFIFMSHQNLKVSFDIIWR